jgi:hypothetical protein
MKTTMMTVGMVACLAPLLLLGCNRSEGGGGGERAACARPAERNVSSSFAFGAAGVSASSRVDRRLSADGGEALHGTTEVTLPGEAHPLLLEESADIDASGRLVTATAELRRGPRGAELVRSVRLDAARGRVTVRGARGESTWLVDTDYPWIYEGTFAAVAPEMESVTAVQAWVARRASQGGSRIRAIDIGDRSSHVTIASQVLLDDGASKWVVVGDEAVEVDSDFVRALPWKSLQSVADARREAGLVCVPGPA